MFRYILKKEFLLISRDIHALLVLFIMPILFILIMSLALQNAYSNKIDIKFNIAINSQSSKDIQYLQKQLSSHALFDAKIIQSNDPKSLLYEDKFDIVLNISSSFHKDVKSNTKDFKIDVFSTPELSFQNKEIFKNLIVELISKKVMTEFFIQYKVNGTTLSQLNEKIKLIDLNKDENFTTQATSVQHSVPSWLIFSMFFILIPISNTFINERNFGTISRLKSIDISFISIILGKIVPYFMINQIQIVLMILVGIYVVPLFNGEMLQINGNYGLIFIAGSAVSLAAISFAILIANISNTSEEATTIGGVSNIILAALGGIMVPKYVMPEFMQNVTAFSPMNWGLESFLEIFVLGGSFTDIKYYLLYLVIFAFICLILSYTILKKKENI